MDNIDLWNLSQVDDSVVAHTTMMLLCPSLPSLGLNTDACGGAREVWLGAVAGGEECTTPCRTSGKYGKHDRGHSGPSVIARSLPHPAPSTCLSTRRIFKSQVADKTRGQGFVGSVKHGCLRTHTPYREAACLFHCHWCQHHGCVSRPRQHRVPRHMDNSMKTMKDTTRSRTRSPGMRRTETDSKEPTKTAVARQHPHPMGWGHRLSPYSRVGSMACLLGQSRTL